MSSGYAAVWAVDWKTSYHFAVAQVLARYTSDDGTGFCALKQRAIARLACCSKRQVQRVLDDMLAADPPQIRLVEQPWENGGKATNLIQLTLSAHVDTTGDPRVSADDFYRNPATTKALIAAHKTEARQKAIRPIGHHSEATGGPMVHDSTPNRPLQYKSEESKKIQERECAPYLIAFNAYNDRARMLGLSVAEKLTEERKTKLKKRLQESGIEGWTRALDAIERSRFLMGERKTERGYFRLTLNFLLVPANLQKAIEGGYDDGRKPKGMTALQVDSFQDKLRTDPAFGRTMAHQWTQDPDRWPPEAGPPPGQPGCVLPISVQDAVLGRGSPTGADAFAHGVHALAQSHAHDDLVGVDLGREHQPDDEVPL